MVNSLEAQIEYFTKYIKEHSGWEFAGIYAYKGITGTKEGRGEFQRMLADCRLKKIDLLVTKAISRFARNTVTLLETVRELKARHIGVFFQKGKYTFHGLQR
jgi:DNA invertase Pin-like site-specific DNA recombinase